MEEDLSNLQEDLNDVLGKDVIEATANDPIVARAVSEIQKDSMGDYIKSVPHFSKDPRKIMTYTEFLAKQAKEMDEKKD